MRREFCVILLLSLLLLVGVAYAEPPMGRVIGKIDCQPDQCAGLAALWSAEENKIPAPDRYVLIPAVVSALEADGSFELLAPPGDYFIGGQLRTTPGPLFGAPRIGDRVYLISPQDKKGYRVTVTLDQPLDIGLQTQFWTFAGLAEKPQMGISGRVLDLDQKPVAGLLVFAFADPGATNTPLAVSARTGADGNFLLPLVEPGSVYLRARKNYRGGQPEAEDYVGVSAGGGAQAISITAGQMIREVKVLVRKLPSVLEMKNAPDTARPKLN